MRKISMLLCFLAITVCSCDQNSFQDNSNHDDYIQHQAAIVNGTPVTGNNHMNAVSLVICVYGYCQSVCGGTLIAPDVVLTAGHCVDSNINPYLSYGLSIGLGQNENSFHLYEVASITPHPDYYYQAVAQGAILYNDIAVIKLKEQVPLSEAVPAYTMTPDKDITDSEIDSAAGVTVNAVGFGKRDPKDVYSVGIKYETNMKVTERCPQNSSRCKDILNAPGYIHVDGRESSVCNGDSGGPAFFFRDGKEYVVGVASFVTSETCNEAAAFVIVSEYYSFIKSIAGNLMADDPEDCTNKKDDNGDNRVDCDDPLCFSEPVCMHEDCGNGQDDNGNGLIDCNDPECASLVTCRPEDCNNNIDDNGNGLVDCKDPGCSYLKKCQPEDCTNKIDDNENGLIDCQDPECVSQMICAVEICDNYKDDNNNGFIDCQDPQCSSALACQPENCADGIDNNGNGLRDCQDPACYTDIHCQPENCTNGIDDNANGFIDCLDVQCASAYSCQIEICNDGIDNNRNGYADCDDIQCINSELCLKATEDPSESCAAMPRKPASPLGFLGIICMGLLAGLGIRRRQR